jgi:hypothetical protein
VTDHGHPQVRHLTAARVWLPRQHGAWAMLLVPLLLGVAASRPDPWQLVLTLAAVAGHLWSSALQAWTRGRRPPAYLPPLTTYGMAFATLGLLLAATFPPLVLSLVVIVPTGLVVFRGARPGTPRDLADSLAQVAQALVLVPAAAIVSGDFAADQVVPYTVVAAVYLVGTVLVVRSVLRERGNDAFVALSIGFHAVAFIVAAVLLPWPYAVLAIGLTVRAGLLPFVQRRRAGGPHPLRPIQVGMVEIVASVAVVLVGFVVPI